MLEDKYYRWVIVLYSLVIQAVCVGILIYCFALFSLPWLDEFGASRRDVMLTISCFQLGMGVLAPLVGRIFDIYPSRYIVLLGVVCLGLGLWLCQYASALWQLWLIYATVLPLSSVLMGTLASQTLVTKWFNEQRGLALGVSAMGTNIGGMIFPFLVSGWLLDIGWRDTFEYLALLSIGLVVPLTWFVLRREPPSAEHVALASTNSDQAVLANMRLWTSREILTSVMFWLPFLSLVPLNMSFAALQFNLGAFARDAGLGGGEAALLITVSSFCMILGKLFCGTLGDRLDHRFIFWLSSALMIVATVIFLYATSYVALISAVICMGLAGGGILPLMGLIFSTRFGAASMGQVMGYVMLNVLFGAAAPVIAGWVFDVFGQYDPALWGLIVLAIPAMIAMLKLPPPPDSSF